MGPNGPEEVSTMLFRNAFERKMFTLGVAYSAAVAALMLLFTGNVFTSMDSLAHTYIAATVVKNGVHSKFSNIGTLWLPIVHLLLAPLTLFKPLYSTGLAGTIVNGIATGGILIFLTRIVEYVTDRKDVLYGSVVLFLSSGMTAIYSATPMMEQVSIFFGLAGVYYFAQYWKEDYLPKFVTSSIYIVLATLTRTEFWFVAAAFVVAMGIKELRNGAPHNLAFFHLPLWGGFLWLVWNAAIFADPFYFLASRSMAVSVGMGSSLTSRALFLGILLIIGGGTFLLPFFLNREYYCLAIAPATAFGMFVIVYLLGFRGLLHNLRFGYVVFGMLLPSVVVLRRVDERKAVVILALLVLSAVVSSGLALTGVYAEKLGSSEVQETNAHQVELPNAVVLHPISHGYDMDHYPEKYLDGYDGQAWINASEAPWDSDVDFVVIPSVEERELENYRVSGPNEGIVWNFHTNEEWKTLFLQHFELVDPELRLYKRVNSTSSRPTAIEEPTSSTFSGDEDRKDHSRFEDTVRRTVNSRQRRVSFDSITGV